MKSVFPVWLVWWAALSELAAGDTDSDRVKRQVFRPQQGGVGRQQSFRVSGPQRFEKDPITGQFVPVGDRDGLSGAGISGGLSQLPWLGQVVGPNLTLALSPASPNVASFARSTNFQIARDQPDLMYQECRTPTNQYGRCRHLVYCMLPEFTSYQAFLPYGCPIQGRYVGACCPRPGPAVAPGFPSVPGQTQTPAPTTNFDACGVGPHVRIVGGVPAREAEFPWVVAVMRTGANPNQYCGGALISNRHVLTAAHCLAGFDWSTIWVRVGEYDFSQNGDTPHIDVQIADFRLHSNFNSRTFENDIALLILGQPVTFNKHVRKICLPPAGESFINRRATVTGWGALAYQGPVSPVLNKVELPIWDNERCDAAYDQPIRSTMLCAGLPEGGQDSCQDDSGGPLMVEINNNWAVVGIVSFGTRCAEPGKPGVYTRVNSFLDWIRSNA
ncbi:venom protease-like [Penaeus chinensis]|uniref:venom protease-like n=1 Tax=Penaeus chinensis TaxID=139456 RepID=UPI001FB7BA63|nr:venom protease-like [Penaeus chinensis]